jgi:hypothetical protein
MRRILFILALLIPAAVSQAQHSYRLGILPAVNLSVDLGKGWKLNAKAESRQSILTGQAGEGADAGYDYVLTDLSVIPSRKIGLNHSAAAGYQVRFRDGSVSHRLIQQFTLVSKFDAFRLAQRFAADQTFRKDTDPLFRLRYRLVAEIPLSGASVDPGEFYLKLGNEYLFEWQDSVEALEIRAVPLIGYEISDRNKLEFGLDYRIATAFNSRSAGALWLSINWFSAL